MRQICRGRKGVEEKKSIKRRRKRLVNRLGLEFAPKAIRGKTRVPERRLGYLGLHKEET